MCSAVMDKYAYSLFQVYGVELEYMVVDRKTLDVFPIVDKLFQDIHGEITSSIEDGEITLDNELAQHVVELKTTEPAPLLAPLAAKYHQKVKEINKRLVKWDACLMPSAMHPWMDPYKETKLWEHGSSEIYNAFNAIFNCKGHGYGNLQSAHLNLPFGNEEEFVRLHQAIRIVLPLIPALAASSPFIEGKHAQMKDKRLDVYQNNSKKIFSIAGHIIPEPCASYEEYRTKILEKIYKDLTPYDPEGILCHEWVNARGAIARFYRGSIEIRLVDVQENPYQDLAIIDALSRLVQHLMQGNVLSYDQFSEVRLKSILQLGIEKAEEATIVDREYLALFGINESRIKARLLWKHIIQNLIDPSKDTRGNLDIILEEGTLATRLEKRAGTGGQSALHQTYRSLCTCLDAGEPFLP